MKITRGECCVQAIEIENRIRHFFTTRKFWADLCLCNKFNLLLANAVEVADCGALSRRQAKCSVLEGRVLAVPTALERGKRLSHALGCECRRTDEEKMEHGHATSCRRGDVLSCLASFCLAASCFCSRFMSAAVKVQHVTAFMTKHHKRDMARNQVIEVSDS